MTDEQLVIKANELLSKGNYTRFGLAKRLWTSKYRLDKLADAGLIPNYPKPMTPSEAATYGRKLSGDKWGKKFTLRGSPLWVSKAQKQP